MRAKQLYRAPRGYEYVRPEYVTKLHYIHYSVYTEHPEDMNMFVQRAAANSGLQDWSAVIADLSHVLWYQVSILVELTRVIFLQGMN